MRRILCNIGERRLVPALVAALIAASPLALASSGDGRPPPVHPAVAASRLALRSPGLVTGASIAPEHVYDESGCRGGNISPALAWSHPPAGTRSFAVLMLDPDAPGGGWWHWAVFDIPAGVTSLPAGAGAANTRLLPPGAIQARNDWGSLGYGGPCPPPGPPHHYRLTLYALRSARLGLGASASAADVAARVRAEALAEAQIVALYGR